MRNEIHEPTRWIARLRQNETENQSWTSRRRQSPAPAAGNLTVDAIDAAFEDVELDTEHQSPHRIDNSPIGSDAPAEIVERLTVQLAALEAQCHHLQGLLNSVKS